MAAKKAKAQLKREPLLSAVARKLGQAAGTVTNLAHELLAPESAENSSTRSATVATNRRASATIRSAAKASAGPSVHRRKKPARRGVGTTRKTKLSSSKPTRSRD